MPRQQQAPATTQPTRIITRKNSVRTHFVEWAHITSYSLRIFNIVHHRLYAHNSLSWRKLKRLREWERVNERKNKRKTRTHFIIHITHNIFYVYLLMLFCVCACLSSMLPVSFHSNPACFRKWFEKSARARTVSIPFILCVEFMRRKKLRFFLSRLLHPAVFQNT